MKFKIEGKYSGVVLFDNKAIKLLFGYRWNIVKRGKTFYAATRIGTKGPVIYMHRMIMGAKKSQIVDHKNNNGLDNRTSNLRFCTKSENLRNRAQKTGAKFKGITLTKRTPALSNPWTAYIAVNGKKIHLGYFKTETEAAEAYNSAAKKHFKYYAYLNKITKESK